MIIFEPQGELPMTDVNRDPAIKHAIAEDKNTSGASEQPGKGRHT